MIKPFIKIINLRLYATQDFRVYDTYIKKGDVGVSVENIGYTHINGRSWVCAGTTLGSHITINNSHIVRSSVYNGSVVSASNVTNCLINNSSLEGVTCKDIIVNDMCLHYPHTLDKESTIDDYIKASFNISPDDNGNFIFYKQVYFSEVSGVYDSIYMPTFKYTLYTYTQEHNDIGMFATLLEHITPSIGKAIIQLRIHKDDILKVSKFSERFPCVQFKKCYVVKEIIK